MAYSICAGTPPFSPRWQLIDTTMAILEVERDAGKLASGEAERREGTDESGAHSTWKDVLSAYARFSDMLFSLCFSSLHIG